MEMLPICICCLQHGAGRSKRHHHHEAPSMMFTSSGLCAWNFTSGPRIQCARLVRSLSARFTKRKKLGYLSWSWSNRRCLTFNLLNIFEFNLASCSHVGWSLWGMVLWGLPDPCAIMRQFAATLHAAVSWPRSVLGGKGVLEVSSRVGDHYHRFLW